MHLDGYAEVGLGGGTVTSKWDLGAGPLRRSGTWGRRAFFAMPPAPVPPPWTLVSPTGVQYFVRDLTELNALAASEGGRDLQDDLHKLVGQRIHSKSAKALPLHRQQWQLIHPQQGVGSSQLERR